MRSLRGFLALIVLGATACSGSRSAVDGEKSRCDEANQERSCTPEVVASDQWTSPTTRLALDETRAYWTFGRMIFDAPAQATGTVMSVPVTSGVPTVVASEQFVPSAVAVGTSDVFWLDDFLGWIVKTPKAGGAATYVVPCHNGSGLAVDDENVFFLDYDDGGPGVFKVPVGGGAAVRLATGEGQLEAIALDDAHVYWADYVPETGVSRVMKVSINGGEPVVLHSEELSHSYSGGLAVDPSGVYYTGVLGEGAGANGAANVKLLKIPLDGGATVTLAEEPGVDDVALDSKNAYFTVTFADSRLGAVRQVPLDGGSVSTVATDQLGLTELVANDSAVCWLNDTTGNKGEVVCHERCDDGC